MSSYYTQAVFINEVPDFLSIEKISYEVQFSNSISKNLYKVLVIPAYSLSKNESASLVIKVDKIPIKKIKLDIYSRSTYPVKKISLKSILSETCTDRKNTCTFDLKLKIYQIDKKNNRAILMNYNSIELLSKKENKYTGYYIYRRSKKLSQTSKETIEYINNPNKLKNEYVKKALSIFKAESSKSGSKEYQPLIYKIVMVKIFESFLKEASNPKTIIEDIDNIVSSK